MEEHFRQWLPMLLSSLFKVLRESSRLCPSDRLFPCQSRTNKVARAVWGRAPGSSGLSLGCSGIFGIGRTLYGSVLGCAFLSLLPASCQLPPSGSPGATRCSQESLGAIGAGCCLLRPHCPSADKSASFAAAFQTLTLMFCDNLAIYISLISSVINIIEAPQW